MNIFQEALEIRNRIELCKAGLLNTLENLYGSDEQKWLQALEKARPRMNGLYLIALNELVRTLEKRARVGSSRHKTKTGANVESDKRGIEDV